MLFWDKSDFEHVKNVLPTSLSHFSHFCTLSTRGRGRDLHAMPALSRESVSSLPALLYLCPKQAQLKQWHIPYLFSSASLPSPSLPFPSFMDSPVLHCQLCVPWGRDLSSCCLYIHHTHQWKHQVHVYFPPPLSLQPVGWGGRDKLFLQGLNCVFACYFPASSIHFSV